MSGRRRFGQNLDGSFARAGSSWAPHARSRSRFLGRDLARRPSTTGAEILGRSLGSSRPQSEGQVIQRTRSSLTGSHTRPTANSGHDPSAASLDIRGGEVRHPSHDSRDHVQDPGTPNQAIAIPPCTERDGNPGCKSPQSDIEDGQNASVPESQEYSYSQDGDRSSQRSLGSSHEEDILSTVASALESLHFVPARLQEERKRFKENIASKLSNISKLREDNRNLSQELSCANSALDEFEDREALLQDECSRQKDSMASMLKDIHAQKSELKTVLDELAEEKETRSSERCEHDRLVSEMKDGLAEKGSNLAQTERALHSAQDELHYVQRKIEEQFDRIRDMEKQHGTTQHSLLETSSELLATTEKLRRTIAEKDQMSENLVTEKALSAAKDQHILTSEEKQSSELVCLLQQLCDIRDENQSRASTIVELRPTSKDLMSTGRVFHETRRSQNQVLQALCRSSTLEISRNERTELNMLSISRLFLDMRLMWDCFHPFILSHHGRLSVLETCSQRLAETAKATASAQASRNIATALKSNVHELEELVARYADLFRTGVTMVNGRCDEIDTAVARVLRSWLRIETMCSGAIENSQCNLEAQKEQLVRRLRAATDRHSKSQQEVSGMIERALHLDRLAKEIFRKSTYSVGVTTHRGIVVSLHECVKRTRDNMAFLSGKLLESLQRFLKAGQTLTSARLQTTRTRLSETDTNMRSEVAIHLLSQRVRVSESEKSTLQDILQETQETLRICRADKDRDQCSLQKENENLRKELSRAKELQEETEASLRESAQIALDATSARDDCERKLLLVQQELESWKLCRGRSTLERRTSMTRDYEGVHSVTPVQSPLPNPKEYPLQVGGDTKRSSSQLDGDEGVSKTSPTEKKSRSRRRGAVNAQREALDKDEDETRRSVQPEEGLTALEKLPTRPSRLSLRIKMRARQDSEECSRALVGAQSNLRTPEKVRRLDLSHDSSLLHAPKKRKRNVTRDFSPLPLRFCETTTGTTGHENALEEDRYRDIFAAGKDSADDNDDWLAG